MKVHANYGRHVSPWLFTVLWVWNQTRVSSEIKTKKEKFKKINKGGKKIRKKNKKKKSKRLLVASQNLRPELVKLVRRQDEGSERNPSLVSFAAPFATESALKREE